MKQRRKQITFELNQTTVIRSQRPFRITWCTNCAADVLMLTAEHAAVLSSLDTRAIYRLIEAGNLHSTETPTGLLVCLNSLRQSGELSGRDFISRVL